MIRYFFLFLLCHSVITASYANRYDLGKPFGWTNCSTLTVADSYNTCGGGEWSVDTPNIVPGKRVSVLISTGGDMYDILKKAIRDNDIIILDGTRGDFTLSRKIILNGLRDKTIVGRNNARLCTSFHLSPELHAFLNAHNVLQLSTQASATPFQLCNGSKVKEEREYTIRKLLIESTGDTEERYRDAGIFALSECENIIFRNLSLIGPGAIDVAGSDLITLSHHTRHIWIDHCTFSDGMDGNIDINSHSDFVTLSWCRMVYTSRTYIHANTCLVGSSDRESANGEDNLNTTFAYCLWDKGCDQRMPMVRFGTVHVLNNLYLCAGNTSAVNPRCNSEVLTEGCYFGSGVKRIFRQTDAKAFILRNNIYTEEFSAPEDYGTIILPYQYHAIPTSEVPEIVGRNAGAVLTTKP